ncbi:MAG: glycosyltransferase [Patescibacteria group bacterium]
MKFAVISNLYPPLVRGGAEMIAATEAEGLKAAWQHVFVIATKPRKMNVNGVDVRADNELVWQDEVNSVSVYRITPFNVYYYLNDYKYPAILRLLWHFLDIFNWHSYFQVKKILLEEKPDVVITHNLMGLGFLLPLLFRKLHITHIHTLHDVQLVTPSGLIIKGAEDAWQHKFFKSIGYPRLMRKLFASPQIVISPSKFLLDFYKQYDFFPKSKKIVLPNPIGADIGVSKKSSYNLEVLYLGQVQLAKGVLGLIKAWRALELPDARLHIVGVGSDLVAAQSAAQADKRIVFHGWMTHPKLMELLGSMDILVVPSLCYENSPTVIYEALGMGLPVLASDIGGVSELIREGVNGWVFPAGDFAALNKKIISLYAQRDRLSLMADNCRASVAGFSRENYIQTILDLLNENKQ